jgi:NAD(P)-dependent dehydrogenase (short-subunit alcohol dehydrogenase family)
MINYLDKFLLKNKVAFVTGGLGLIGRQISLAFASAQATTVILDIDDAKGQLLVKEIKSNGYNAHYEHFNATDLEQSATNLMHLFKTYGSIDIWVNNAYPRTNDWGNGVEELNLDSWRKNIDMHLNSYSWFSKEVALLMKKKKIKGSIINFGSIYGVVGADFTVYEGTTLTNPMGYAAIKGGIVTISRYLASYFGSNGIRINSICPGGIFDNQPEVFVKNYENKVPLKRMGTPEEIATAVLFLASEASSYVTGSTLMVDGGWTTI